jgi:hypothetical protein
MECCLCTACPLCPFRADLARDLGVSVRILNMGGEEILETLGYRFRKS